MKGTLMFDADVHTKIERVLLIRELLRQPDVRYSTRELAERYAVTENTIRTDMLCLEGIGTAVKQIREGRRRYWVPENRASISDLKIYLSPLEAMSLSLAAQMFLGIQNGGNEYVISAQQKLLASFPEDIAIHHERLLTYAQQRPQSEPSSPLFGVLTDAWYKGQKVRLRYKPLHQRWFDTEFSPYLILPSAIARSLYIIGHSSNVNDIRIYKLDRIQHAELISGSSFLIPEDLDIYTKLKDAWHVMTSDDEPIRVRLRFSENVTSRVFETIWHPSQELKRTREGCEWSALISDPREIEPWVRGWGEDCEVLEPKTLRDNCIRHLESQMHRYGLKVESVGDIISRLYEKRGES